MPVARISAMFERANASSSLGFLYFGGPTASEYRKPSIMRSSIEVVVREHGLQFGAVNHGAYK